MENIGFFLENEIESKKKYIEQTDKIENAKEADEAVCDKRAYGVSPQQAVKRY